jgi:hypothetical protein
MLKRAVDWNVIGTMPCRIRLEWTDLELRRRTMHVQPSLVERAGPLAEGRAVTQAASDRAARQALRAHRHLNGPRALYYDDMHLSPARKDATIRLLDRRPVDDR